MTPNQIKEKLQPYLKQWSDATVSFSSGRGPGSGSAIDVTLLSDDDVAASRVSEQIIAILSEKVPELTDITSDIENGRYTKEQLIEITKYFMWNLYCIKAVANLPFYICGMDENGNDATNEFTFLLLETYRELDIYDPKMHVMYHENIISQNDLFVN